MAARIKDVAYRAGVSTATVSHVINNTRYVSDEVKKKVHDAMLELNYSPNPVARSLRIRKSNIIGLIVPVKGNDNSNNFFMTIANGIESVLKQRGYQLILCNSQEDYGVEAERIKMFNTQYIDGLIIAPTFTTEEVEKERKFGDYPVVFIDRKPKHVQGDCVLVKAMDGSYEAVKALIDKGHKRIGFISGKINITSVEDRLLGYLKALEEAGIEADPAIIRSGGSSNWQTGVELTRSVLKEQGVTALFVANNVMCMGTLKYLREINIRVPEQIAIICFDDYEWTEVVDPPLSVVRQPSFELGMKAAEVLLAQIENPEGEQIEIRLPAEFIVRNSF